MQTNCGYRTICLCHVWELILQYQPITCAVCWSVHEMSSIPQNTSVTYHPQQSAVSNFRHHGRKITFTCSASILPSLLQMPKGKGSPYSITECRVPELIPVLDSQPAGDVTHKPGGRLSLLSARPAVTPATLNRAATNFAAC